MERHKTLEHLTRHLPAQAWHELEDFAGFLLKIHGKRRSNDMKRKMRFAWAGALKSLRKSHSSVTLQHHILALRAK